ncbi:hypothetical protein HMPREF9419_2230 [Prevotella nigrescens ATCC 33563]|nr:hypothetical protein HMPREF9419_2230 [Prevotella nigrescens ATCC 33563]
MWCQLQPINNKQYIFLGCDLLKKLYLCGVNYNKRNKIDNTPTVVICLKSCIFVVSITTLYKIPYNGYML